jgi:hypothetical protein
VTPAKSQTRTKMKIIDLITQHASLKLLIASFTMYIAALSVMTAIMNRAPIANELGPLDLQIMPSADATYQYLEKLGADGYCIYKML